jgi:hypothetical protein
MENTIIENQIIEDSVTIEESVVVAKKRGRKKKVVDIDTNPIEPEEKIIKKRGRKPKGGKIIIKPQLTETSDHIVTNVILHLKCKLQDIATHNNDSNQIVSNTSEYVPIAPPVILAYNQNQSQTNQLYNYKSDTDATDIADNSAYLPESTEINTICKSCNTAYQLNNINESNSNQTTTENEQLDKNHIIINKIKQLKIQLYNNVLIEHKSACFWCTYDYDNKPFYIPKTEINGEICGYGSFCRPECAVAFLLKENIDDSVKFDRYQLLNTVYGKLDGYKRNIKPSSDPHYTLDKFCGNLTIQEYRKLLNNGHLLNVVDKPMTRILPELHEDIENNTDSGLSSIKTTGFKVKKQSEKQKGPSKTSILNERFGL